MMINYERRQILKQRENKIKDTNRKFKIQIANKVKEQQNIIKCQRKVRFLLSLFINKQITVNIVDISHMYYKSGMVNGYFFL